MSQLQFSCFWASHLLSWKHFSFYSQDFFSDQSSRIVAKEENTFALYPSGQGFDSSRKKLTCIRSISWGIFLYSVLN